MIRASLYLLVAGVVWLAEGFVFASFFSFSRWQTVTMAAVYTTLLAVAFAAFLRFAQHYPVDREGALPMWRYVSLAPQVALIMGSFVSLPILVAILAVGKII